MSVEWFGEGTKRELLGSGDPEFAVPEYLKKKGADYAKNGVDDLCGPDEHVGIRRLRRRR